MIEGAPPEVMIIGLGDLGGKILDMLAQQGEIGRILVASRDSTRGIARCNLARLSAQARGFDPVVEFIRLDISEDEEVAETILHASPQIILCTASLMTWWLPNILPPDKAELLGQAGFGVWLPVHLVLPMKLSAVLNESGFGGVTLMGPYPDVVNCILARTGFTPTCGIGNLAEMVPKVRGLAATQLGVHPSQVQVYLVAHHALGAYVFGQKQCDRPPHYLRVIHQGEDVTTEVNGPGLLFSPHPIPKDRSWNYLTAACAVHLICCLLKDEDTLLHVPGPVGLPGGYPVMASRQGIRLSPLPDISLDEAISINVASQPFDGIEQIRADGSVVYVPGSVDIMRKEFGYTCEQLIPGEVESVALELIQKFRSYAARFGVNFPISSIE